MARADREQGARLLSKVNVQEYLSERIKDREKRTEITQDAVLKELAKIGFANMMDYMSSASDRWWCFGEGR